MQLMDCFIKCQISDTKLFDKEALVRIDTINGPCHLFVSTYFIPKEDLIFLKRKEDIDSFSYIRAQLRYFSEEELKSIINDKQNKTHLTIILPKNSIEFGNIICVERNNVIFGS